VVEAAAAAAVVVVFVISGAYQQWLAGETLATLTLMDTCPVLCCADSASRAGQAAAVGC
jgi:hypothetical protein